MSPQRKLTLASSSGSLGFIVCVKCCRMVDSVPRWWLSLSWPIQSDHLWIADRMIPTSGRKHSHGKTQSIPWKQVLVRSWLWKFILRPSLVCTVKVGNSELVFVTNLFTNDRVIFRAYCIVSSKPKVSYSPVLPTPKCYLDLSLVSKWKYIVLPKILSCIFEYCYIGNSIF